MIAQLTFPAESDASVGSLVNYNPYAPKPLTNDLALRAADDPERAHLRDHALAGHRLHVGGRATSSPSTSGEGVKWSDGSRLHRKDVAFTFNLMKKYPAWTQPASGPTPSARRPRSVTAEGNQVVFVVHRQRRPQVRTGSSASRSCRSTVYATVGDPTKYVDKDAGRHRPVQGRQLQRPPARAGPPRPDYWQADKIKVEKLVLEGNYDAAQAALKLRCRRAGLLHR